MEKPSECRWCGCGSVYSTSDRHVKFACRSSWTADGDCWACGSQCCDGMQHRIQRAVDALKKAERYTVTPGPRNTLDWDTDLDGPVTDSAAVDEALAILEGERDETT